MIKIGNMLQIGLIAAAHAHIFIRQQPCGQAAKIPLRTDIRAGPHNCIKAQLLRNAQKTDNVQHPRKIEDAFFRLVQIPANISFHCIKASEL